MSPGDFKAQLGRQDNPGLLSQEARLAWIQPGQNPYVTGPALPGNSPVFFERIQHGRMDTQKATCRLRPRGKTYSYVLSQTTIG